MTKKINAISRRMAIGAIATSGAAVYMPHIAKSATKLNWRIQSSFPKSLDGLYGSSELFAKRINEMSSGEFNIQIFSPGEIVGPLQTLDAVQNGTVEMSHTASYWFVGKDPTFAFGAALPFGLNTRQQDAWLNQGSGKELLDKFYTKYNVKFFPFGSTGAQMGGWFRKEINSENDLKGLKMRIPGLAGKIMAEMGVVPQNLPGGEIYTALEKGTIDATEWIGPYDDAKLGFVKVAPYYYFPGFWEVGPNTNIFINQEKWDSLPGEYQAMIQAAAAEASRLMINTYDAKNAVALRQLVGEGAQLRAFPEDVVEKAYVIAEKMYAEIAAENSDFAEIFDNWTKFRSDANLWFSVSETPMDQFMQRVTRS